ncbi:MAG: gliding motility-associated ABC transporter ATP-binding subunit GldA [Sphingobacteriia bacterium]|nr:gliding motility-associated ABC transporter ATP-binding subunit GldA [Sphingobacteriia bacterium]
MSIEVHNITKIYGKQKALNNISFEINTSGVVGLLGPNGAGKSTIMKILTCFIPPTEGSAKVHGFDVISQSVEVRKRIGYLPENNPLYTEMYIREFLEFSAGTYLSTKDISKRISEVIHITGLEKESQKKIQALSKGFRQRVGLAQALLHNPDILILDEPTSGLDPNQIVEIRNLIKEIGKEKTVLLSTHIMQEVEAICDKVIIINQGEIVANTDTANINDLFSGNVSVLVEFENEVAINGLMKIDGVLGTENTGNNKYRIDTKKNFDARSTVFKWAVSNNYTIVSLQTEKHRLEDVFQQLTNK